MTRLPLLGDRRLQIALALALCAGALALLRSGPAPVHLSAYFPSTVGVYQGSEVRLMGVPIGRIDKITPEGTRVRIDMHFDGHYRLPSDAKAVIVSPSLVSDRFVQLTPAYSGHGRVLQNHAVIPESRTRVPIELDQIYNSANDLLKGLGPQGANDDGAVNRLLAVGAANLKGQGPALRSLIQNLSGASSTLGASSTNFFDSVDHLEKFTSTLANNDADVRRFNRQMATVSRFLAGERGDLSAALTNLASTFGLVEQFVSQNRDLLASNFTHLARISAALVAEKTALQGIMRVLPTAASNMARSWDNQNQSIRARANEAELTKNLDGLICDALKRAGIPAPGSACSQLSDVLAELGLK